jgi:hypothetical protein
MLLVMSPLFALLIFTFTSCGSTDTYDVVVIGGGFSGLYTTMRLAQANKGSIMLVESNKPSSIFVNGKKIPHNGLPSNHACLGGKITDIPYSCEKIKDCKEDIIWFGDHAMRYKTSTV